MKINQARSFCFKNGKNNVDSFYFFIPERVTETLPGKNLLLVIDLKKEQLKISKPESILNQPNEIIDKIVEREIKKFFEAAA